VIVRGGVEEKVSECGKGKRRGRGKYERVGSEKGERAKEEEGREGLGRG